MAKDVYVRLNASEVNYLINSENGPTGQYLLSKVIQGERISKRLVNVDTGELRASITHEIGVDSDGLYGRWGTDVDYGLHQEYLPEPHGKPYLRPAIEMIT